MLMCTVHVREDAGQGVKYAAFLKLNSSNNSFSDTHINILLESVQEMLVWNKGQ